VYVTAGDERKHCSGKKDSARRDNRRGRSCFVALCEVEETSVGMRMTKTGGGQYASDLYSLRLDAWADQWKFARSPSFVNRASLARDPGGRSSPISYFLWTELVQGPFASQTSANNVYCLFQSQSNLSIFPNPASPLIVANRISPNAVIPPLPVTARDSGSQLSPVLGPTLAAPPPTFRVRLEWASASLKVSTSGVRQDLSLCVRPVPRRYGC
jgi:hypothetical protein